MRIYPTAGLLVRDPVKRDFLPAEGREVPDGDLYWSRRLNFADATTRPPARIAEAVDSTSHKPAKAPAGSDEQ